MYLRRHCVEGVSISSLKHCLLEAAPTSTCTYVCMMTIIMMAFVWCLTTVVRHSAPSTLPMVTHIRVHGASGRQALNIVMSYKCIISTLLTPYPPLYRSTMIHPFPLKGKRYFRKVDFPLSGNFPYEGKYRRNPPCHINIQPYLVWASPIEIRHIDPINNNVAKILQN